MFSILDYLSVLTFRHSFVSQWHDLSTANSPNVHFGCQSSVRPQSNHKMCIQQNSNASTTTTMRVRVQFNESCIAETRLFQDTIEMNHDSRKMLWYSVSGFQYSLFILKLYCGTLVLTIILSATIRFAIAFIAKGITCFA